MSAPNNPDAGKHGSNDPEDTAPTRTRTRVSRACTRCRARKDKCDGGTPSCANCVNADQPCSYDQATKKRGLPEGYVRAVEKLWAVTFTRIPGLEDALLQTLNQDRDLLTTIWNHREVGEDLHARWKDSRIFQELETFLNNVDRSTATGTKRKREKEDDDELDGSLSLDVILPPRFALQTLSQAELSMPRSSERVDDTFQLPSSASELVGHYFKFTHCWFPILNRPQILKQCYELSRKPTQTNHENGPLAVLAAVLSYSSQQQSQMKEMLPSIIDATQIANVARRCIPDMDGSFSVSHLQALLILALADMTTGRWDMAWRALGLVSRVLMETSGSSSTLTREQTAVRQGCSILDALVSAKLDRPPQQMPLSLASFNHLSPDGHEEWEPWPGTSEPAFIISCFNDLTKVTSAMSQYHGEQQMCPTRLTNGRVEEILADLNTLSTTYPPASQPLSARTALPHQNWLRIVHLLVAASVAAAQESKADLVVTYLGSTVNIFKELAKETASEASQVPAWTIAPAFLAFRKFKAHIDGSKYAPTAKHTAVLRSFAKHSANLSGSMSEELSLLVELITKEKEPNTLGSSVTRRVSTNATMAPAAAQPPPRQTFFPVDPFAQSGLVRSGSNGSQLPNVTFNGPGHVQSPDNHMQVDWNSVIDIPTGNTNMAAGGLITGPLSNGHRIDASGMYNPSIATSPSFQGDEIDALFHEMAQLDTTEWASGRNQGLKDFGFDDLSFQQFCNDPDRLFSGGFTDDQPSTFHNRQPSDYQMADVLPPPQTFGYPDVSENTWNG